MMKRSWILGLAAVAICLSPLAIATSSGRDTSDTPQRIHLGDLADGESRTFSEGGHAITATRKGDEVILTVRGKEGEKTLRFTIGKDSPTLMTLDADGESLMTIRRQAGEAGHDEQTYIVTAGADESGRVVIHGTGHGTMITTSGSKVSGAGAKIVQIVAEGGTVLRCPEGDATLTLKKGEEEDGPYFCPRHNLKMEPSEGTVFLKEMMLEGGSGSEDEEY